LLRALELERPRHHPPELAHQAPALGKLGREPLAWQRRVGLEMDAGPVRLAIAREPSLLGGEAEDRREPAREAVEDLVEHRAHCPPPRRLGRVAIERVLSYVEIEGGKVDGAEMMERGEEAVEVVGLDRAPHQRIELGQAMEHEALELRHRLRRDAL